MSIIDRLKNDQTRTIVHATRARMAAIRAGYPGKKLTCIGITGTKGKSTTTHLVSSILRAAGQRVGHVSTVEFRINDTIEPNDTNKTNLPPQKLQPLLKRMVQEQCRYAVLEVSSHGIHQQRLFGVPFKIAVLTNMGHDHLDYHGTFEEYRSQKIRLFTLPSVTTAIVNGDDTNAAYFLDDTTAPDKIVYTAQPGTPTVAKKAVIVSASAISLNPAGASFKLSTDTESITVRLHLSGLFNVYNALAAASVGVALNLKLGTIKQGLEDVPGIPGRMEQLETNRGFSVIIDYAHTPDSLEAIYQTLRPVVRGKLIAVFGATGDRDRTKRPIMGAIAARYADYVILTDEEPYTEDPAAIINEVAAGVPRGRSLFAGRKTSARPRREMKIHDVRQFLKKDSATDGENEWWWRVPDRTDAITKAIDMAGFDDVIVITGMGAQNYKVVGAERVPWNERSVVEKILQKRKFLDTK